MPRTVATQKPVERSEAPKVRTFLKRHSVTAYFVLAFAISWGCVIAVLGPGGVLDTTVDEKQIERLLPLVILALAIGPTVAGVLLTGLVDGRAGLRELLSRSLRWRVGARWYAVALLTAPLSVAAPLLVLQLISPEFRPGIFTTSDMGSVLMFGIVSGLAVGILEELGWTGFAVPRMRLIYGVFATGLIVGMLWGLWHLPVNYWGVSSTTGGLPVAVVLPVFLVSFLPPYRILMVWVYDRTDSVLLTILMHASLIAFWTAFTPVGIAGAPLVIWYLAWAVLLWVVVAAVAIANSGRLQRQSPPK